MGLIKRICKVVFFIVYVQGFQRCKNFPIMRKISILFSDVSDRLGKTQSPEVSAGSESELPDSFLDSVERATQCTIRFLRGGGTRCRIDFDTSVGDLTYTSLKKTLPMTKELCNIIAKEMGLTLTLPPPPPAAQEKELVSAASTELANTDANVDAVAAVIPDEDVSEPKWAYSTENVAPKTMRLFFPDMGAAALARRDWKMGTNRADVPPCVYTANIQNDPISATDKLAIILCPLYSEADFVSRVLELCDIYAIPCVIINPELINMDQGFGLRAKQIRKNVLSSLTLTYKLKTLADGALVREWPKGFSVWKTDDSLPEGYRLLKTVSTDPTRETLDDIFEESATGVSKAEAGNAVINAIGGITGFFKGLSQL